MENDIHQTIDLDDEQVIHHNIDDDDDIDDIDEIEKIELFDEFQMIIT